MIRPFVVAALCFFAFWAMVADVWSHSFYPRECCSGTDCAPLDSERVRVTPDGYMIDGRHLVPHRQAKFSPDEHYHGCFPAPMLGKIGCFWAPQRAY